MRIAGIYKITSPSGRIYIGQSWNIKQRWYEYRSPGFRPTQPKLHASFQKYGAKNHDYSILMRLPQSLEQTIMDECERFFIALHRDAGVRMLNLAYGGGGSRHSAETRHKIGLKSKGHPPNRGSFQPGRPSPKSAAWRLKMSAIMAGRRVSDDTKRKLSELNTGALHPKFGTKHSPETRARISAALTGKTYSDERKRSMSIRLKREFETGRRPRLLGDASAYRKLNSAQVRQIKTDYSQGEVSYQSLADKYDVSVGAVGKIIRGETWAEI